MNGVFTAAIYFGILTALIAITLNTVICAMNVWIAKIATIAIIPKTANSAWIVNFVLNAKAVKIASDA